MAAGPLNREKVILYGEIDTEAAHRARRSLDVSGHYPRPDIFSLGVDRRALQPVTFSDQDRPATSPVADIAQADGDRRAN